MSFKSANPWGASLCVLVPVVAALGGCSHDWDLLDPALSTGGGGGMGGSSSGGTSAHGGGPGGGGGSTTSSSSSAGGSSTTSTGSTTTTTTAECTQDADCPGSGNPCVSSVCQSGACIAVEKPDGSLVSAGSSSNCLDTVCDGGQAEEVPNSENCTDPSPDNCIVPSCAGDGSCSGTNAPVGHPCLDANNMASTCDGNGVCL